MAPLRVPCFRCSALNHANVGCFCCFLLTVVWVTEAADNSRKQRNGLCQLLAGWRKHSEVYIRFKLEPCSVQNGYFRGEKTKEQGNNAETVGKKCEMEPSNTTTTTIPASVCVGFFFLAVDKHQHVYENPDTFPWLNAK